MSNERKSLLITTNQPFSQWDSIFSDSMMTVAAIDRLVHHATIIELQAESFRKRAALARSMASTELSFLLVTIYSSLLLSIRFRVQEEFHSKRAYIIDI